MGRLATFVSATDETIDGDKQIEIQAELAKDDPVTAPYFGPAGVVSKPVKGDLVVLVRLAGKGEFAAVGFSDPVNAQSVALGEVKIIGRDSDGNPVSSITISGDGRILMENDNGQMELKADGQVSINNHLTVDP
jgi:hypothetical protein